MKHVLMLVAIALLAGCANNPQSAADAKAASAYREGYRDAQREEEARRRAEQQQQRLPQAPMPALPSLPGGVRL